VAAFIVLLNISNLVLIYGRNAATILFSWLPLGIKIV